MDTKPTPPRPAAGLSRTGQFVVVGTLAVLIVAGFVFGPQIYRLAAPAAAVEPAPPAAAPNTFKPTDKQLAGLTIQTLAVAAFQDERSADGKIAVDDDHNTPVYPPYSGRVTQVFIKAGDHVEKGAPLFRIDSTDLVQAQNDDIAAAAALAKARSQVTLLSAAYKRQQALLAIQGAAVKDVQQAQADLTGAENDQRSAEIALAATRDRLHILGITDGAIRVLEATRRTDPSLVIPAPLAGTITLRKLGPGQYVNGGASDPVVTVGDLKLVWLIANARESDAPLIHVGEKVRVTVTAYPGKVFNAVVSYVAPTVDPDTHRLPLRAEVQNDGDMLKPEMFANFTIDVAPQHMGVAVPEDAVVYDGESARVWVLQPDGSLAGKPITIGTTNGGLVEALSGVAAGDKIVTKGSIFIDRAASED